MSYVSEILADAPKGYWKLDEASGNFADSSGNGHTLTKAGTPTYSVAGPFPGVKAVTFGATEQATTTTTIQSAVNNLTMEFWVKFGAVAHMFPLFVGDYSGGTQGNSVELTAGGKIQNVCFGPFSSQASSTLSPGTVWRHIVVVRDSGTWKYYIDGVLDTASAGTATPGSGAGGLRVSAIDASNNMTLCNVAVYDTVLSPARILAHYNSFYEVDTRTTVSSSEVYKTPILDSGTVTSRTAVTAIERGPYSDLATISTTTAIETGEYDYVHPTGYWGPFDTDNGSI